MNSKEAHSNAAMRHLCFLVLIPLISHLLLISCTREQKAKDVTAESSRAVETNAAAEFAFNQDQQELLDNYVQRLKDFPNFTAGSPSEKSLDWKYYPAASELADLIDKHDLESVMGDGTEMKRFINLMDWVHNATYSEGDLGNPDTLNAAAIINYVKTEKRAVNCKMKSVVLNELLLAFGYYSRRISCKPSQFDGDLHSIVAVYCSESGKWVCLDPTFNTYFHDTAGNLLGYLEIRGAYANGEIPAFRSIQISHQNPLMLQGIEFPSYDQWYAVYMAKNCFQASCPRISRFGYENSESRSLVDLVPEGFTVKDRKTGTIVTSNSDDFFRKP